MSRIVSTVTKDSFALFLIQLEENWAIDNTQVAPFLAQLKGAHKLHIALCCAVRALRDRGANSVFISQLAENSFLSFVFALKGMENPCCVQLRQMIELTLKHIYFATHPVEYSWVSTQDGLREYGFQPLLEYFQRLQWPFPIEDARISDTFTAIFSETSRYVHVHSSKFLSTAIQQKKPAEIRKVITVFSRLSSDLFPAIIVLLIIDSPDRYLKCSESEKKIISGGLPKSMRTFLAGVLKKIALSGA